VFLISKTCWALISTPKILRDTQKGRGKPGCLNNYRIQVLARGGEMIEQERRLPPFDPNVWSGRAMQEVLSSGVSGLASMYPASDWSMCSGPSWISARMRSH
jgi:hypothetical protein